MESSRSHFGDLGLYYGGFGHRFGGLGLPRGPQRNPLRSKLVFASNLGGFVPYFGYPFWHIFGLNYVKNHIKGGKVDIITNVTNK